MKFAFCEARLVDRSDAQGRRVVDEAYHDVELSTRSAPQIILIQRCEDIIRRTCTSGKLLLNPSAWDGRCAGRSRSRSTLHSDEAPGEESSSSGAK
jgi:hypothetical protein